MNKAMEVSPNKLAELGYRLIPVVKSGKRPLITNWTGYDADGETIATTNFRKIDEWRNLYGQCNWGIVCWDCLVVDVDIDKTTGESGFPVWQKLCDENNIPKAPCVITGSGGRHYFFKKPSFEFKNKVKTVVNGKEVPIDIRVGGGGFVVAVGSIHQNGQYYRYEDENNPLPPVDQLPSIPDSFVKKYFVAREPRVSKSMQSLDIDYSDAESSLFVTSCCWRYIDRMAPSIMGQGGSNAIYSVCGKIFWGFNLNADQGWELLNRWNQIHSVPLWSEKELQHKVADSLRNAHNLTYGRGQLRPKPRNDKEDKAEITDEAWRKFIRSVQKDNIDPDSLEIGDDVLSSVPNGTVVEGYSEHWLWKHHIYRGLVLLGGDGGTGKSSLMLDWITRVSAGFDWADGSPCQEGSVIVYIPEDPFARMKVIARELGAKTQNIYCIGDCNEDFIPFSLDNLSLLERLIQQINNNSNLPNVRMVCIDPITASIGDLNENSQSEIRPALKRLGQFTNQYKLATIGLIHPRKQGLADRMTSIKDRIAGSAAWTNVPRQVMILQRDPQDKDIRICLTVKHNLSYQPLGFSYRISKPVLLTDAMDDHSADATPVQVFRYNFENTAIEQMADEFNGQGIYAGSKKKKEREAQTCEDWLLGYLSDGPKPSGTQDEPDTIFGEGWKRYSFNRKMIDRKLKDLGCEYFRKEGRTYWALPAKAEAKDDNFGLGEFGSDEF